MIKVNKKAKEIINRLRKYGFAEVDFPEIKATNLDNWSEKYAMMGTAYYDCIGSEEYFNHDKFKEDFQKYLEYRFPDCKVRFYWQSQEIEIERNDYNVK